MRERRLRPLARTFFRGSFRPIGFRRANLRRTIFMQAKIMQKFLQTKINKIILAGVFSFSVNKVKNISDLMQRSDSSVKFR